MDIVVFCEKVILLAFLHSHEFSQYLFESQSFHTFIFYFFVFYCQCLFL